MIFHFLFLSLIAFALVDELEEMDEGEVEEVVEVVEDGEVEVEEEKDGGGKCNLTKVGRRWFYNKM